MSEWVHTTCVRCAVGCGHLQRGVESGYGIDTVRGDATHPTNSGLACQRGIRETANPEGEWLTRPLVRRDGELHPTTWDVALDIVVKRFRTLVAENRDAVAVLGSGQQTNEAAYLLGKLARGGFGTRHYDANTTLCMASAVTAYYDAFGSDAPPPTYDDIPDAETHVVWGANPSVAHPVMYRWLTQSALGGELIVVDPVRTQTARDADLHVAVEPGKDLQLARAVLAHRVETGGVDRAFVQAHTTGFDALRDSLPDPGEAAERAGVDRADVAAIADALDDRTLVYWGMGVNQSTNGTATCGALIDLCLATGNMGEGAGPFSLTGQANSMGTRVCSAKGTWPGHREFEDPREREIMAAAWGVPEARLPDDPGPGPVGIVEATDETVEAVWTVATNPAAGLPDASRARERLRDTFLVVQDAFHTETVELADVVLPAATWGESEGTVMNMERRVSRVRAATDVPSGVRTDLDIIAAVGEGVCPGLLGTPTPREAFEEFASLTAGTPADCQGIGYPRLEAEGAVRWPAPDAVSEGGYRYREDGGWRFRTPDGRARFSSVVAGELVEPTDEAYPLTLTTGREADAYNTGVRTRADGAGPPVARVTPEAVETHGEAATLTSRRASVEVTLEPDPTVPPGVVWLSIHHPRTNELTTPARDPRSKEPNFKQCAVRLDSRTSNE
ncbi:assimilatory nitrate reductase NasA [Natronomonas sp. EA1]|uniref:assimilatory nitrate reductase NasA n=1 Tax=Natronomonas sp. EA1 TaxID=3421655 RepID=UPI003EBB950E